MKSIVYLFVLLLTVGGCTWTYDSYDMRVWVDEDLSGKVALGIQGLRDEDKEKQQAAIAKLDKSIAEGAEWWRKQGYRDVRVYVQNKTDTEADIVGFASFKHIVPGIWSLASDGGELSIVEKGNELRFELAGVAENLKDGSPPTRFLLYYLGKILRHNASRVSTDGTLVWELNSLKNDGTVYFVLQSD